MRRLAAGEPLGPTPRQIEVLRAYVRYGSHAEAARSLDISVRTVEAHLAALRSRLRVHNEAQAVHVLWLGFRDHLESCARATHEDCVPKIGHALFARGPQRRRAPS